jgi:hypothetical protein
MQGLLAASLLHCAAKFASVNSNLYTAYVCTAFLVAACRSDRHELVRRQALALLANLLMKDYVKWRGPLFHRWAACIGRQHLMKGTPAVAS